MVIKVLHRLAFPGGRVKSLLDSPAFYDVTMAWAPTARQSTPQSEQFHRNLGALVISLYKAHFTTNQDAVASLPRHILSQLLLRAITTDETHLLLKGPLLGAFLMRLRNSREPATSLAFPSLSPNATIIGPPGEIYPLYRLIHKFLIEGSDKQAFQIFQKLVTNEYISSTAMSQIKLDGANLKEILLFSLVRSCLDYEWMTGALELLIEAVRAPNAHLVLKSEHIRAAVNETVFMIQKHASLMSLGPTFAYSKDTTPGLSNTVARRIAPGATHLLQRCMTLLLALQRTDPEFRLDDKIIQSLYELARQLDAGGHAEDLYSIGRAYGSPASQVSQPFIASPMFVRTPSSHVTPKGPQYYAASDATLPLYDCNVRKPQPVYPPPQGPPLTWLMAYLTTISKNKHLARHLAADAADKELEIPLTDRGNFLWFTAGHGYARSARKIWTRYSEDVENGVVGHAGAMLRLVSLYEALARKLGAAQQQDNVSPDNDLTLSEEERPLVDIYLHHPVETGESATAFAELVLSKFRASKEPLMDAAHQDINALARAYFVSGRIHAGFEVFQVIMDKKEMPDLHDVNVALSGMARYSPKLASKMIERMIQRGFVPDSVTFGTVIKEAINRRDRELVVDLVRRAQEVDVHLSFKTIAALVQSGVSDAGTSLNGDTDTLGPGNEAERREISLVLPENSGPDKQLILSGGDDLERVVSNLHTAWELIQLFPSKDTVGIPNLGKDCVRAALRSEQAELGYKFWKFCLRKKTQWDDSEQVMLRKRLGVLIRSACDEGRLEEKKARVMLVKLGTGNGAS